MLLAYRPTTGRVTWNSGFNTNYPMGPPDFVATNAAGTDKLLYRIDDASPEARRIDAGEGSGREVRTTDLRRRCDSDHRLRAARRNCPWPRCCWP